MPGLFTSEQFSSYGISASRKMALQGRWHDKGGTTREMAPHGRWPLKEDGTTRKMALQGRCCHKEDITMRNVAPQGRWQGTTRKRTLICNRTVFDLMPLSGPNWPISLVPGDLVNKVTLSASHISSGLSNTQWKDIRASRGKLGIYCPIVTRMLLFTSHW